MCAPQHMHLMFVQLTVFSTNISIDKLSYTNSELKKMWIEQVDHWHWVKCTLIWEKYSFREILYWTNVELIKLSWTNFQFLQMFNYTNLQLYKLSVVQTFTCTNFYYSWPMKGLVMVQRSTNWTGSYHRVTRSSTSVVPLLSYLRVLMTNTVVLYTSSTQPPQVGVTHV